MSTNNKDETVEATTAHDTATPSAEATSPVPDTALPPEEPITETIHAIDLKGTKFGDFFGQFFTHEPSEYAFLINLLILFGLALLSYLISKAVVSHLARLLANNKSSFKQNILANSAVLKNIAKMLPWLIIQIGISLIPNLNETLFAIVRNVAAALTIFYCMHVVVAFLDAIIQYHTQKNTPRLRSIKSYIQLSKIAVYLLGVILIIASLIDRSPAILLSGLGAMSAITMLIFKDTISSFVAGVQISSNDMLRIGDWIEMPQVGADGNVIDIALHTVRVQNFDKTIVTIPTWRMISESYRNYRGMYEVNARRIKRSLFIDVTSIKFMSTEDIERLSHVNVLKTYLDDKVTEIMHHNQELGEEAQMGANLRRLTNVGTFRSYAIAYLKAHPKIRNDLTLLVRQMQPTSEGLPLEIYCFTTTTVWADYEGIQGDIFDHLYSVLPEFGLRPFQKASGYDVILSMTSEVDNGSPKPPQSSAAQILSQE